MGEFTMIFLSSSIVGSGGFLFAVKNSQVFIFFIYGNLCGPSPNVIVKIHALILADTILVLFFVHGIFGACAFPEIFLAVVQSIMIPMIYLFSFFAMEDFAVHSNCLKHILFFNGTPTSSIKTSSLRCPHSKPMPLIESRKIFGIDDGDLALREGNKSVRFTERLNNSFAFQPIMRLRTRLAHRSTSNGLLNFSRYFIKYGCLR